MAAASWLPQLMPATATLCFSRHAVDSYYQRYMRCRHCCRHIFATPDAAAAAAAAIAVTLMPPPMMVYDCRRR